MRFLGSVKMSLNLNLNREDRLKKFYEKNDKKNYYELYELHIKNSIKSSDSKKTEHKYNNVLEEVYLLSEHIISESLSLFSDENFELQTYLERAGSYLEFSYSVSENIETKLDLGLGAVFSYYISNNTSLSYVLINKIFDEIEIPNLEKLALNLIKKDFKSCHETILNIFDDNKFKEKTIIREYKDKKIDIVEVIFRTIYEGIAQSASNFIEFVITGNNHSFKKSIETINSCISLSEEYGFVNIWRIIYPLNFIYNEIKDNSLWKNLKTFDLAADSNHLINEYIKNYIGRKTPITELWPPQKNTINKINNPKRENFCLKMPTSSGKTLIAELTILRFLLDLEDNPSERSKCIYISPYRSLSSEIEKTFSNSFGKIGFEVSNLYGNSGLTENEIDKIKYSQLIILTPEKLDAILRYDFSITNLVGLIVIDEGHLIDDYKSNRGIVFELLIQRLLLAFKNEVRFLFISAILENANDFSKWLSDSDKNVSQTMWKPTRLSMGYAIWEDNNLNIELSHLDNSKLNHPIRIKNYVTQIETKGKLGRRYLPFPIDNKSRTEVFAVLVLKSASKNTTLAFIPNKGHVKSFATNLLDIIETIKKLQRKGHFKDINIVHEKTGYQKKKILEAQRIIENEYGKDSEIINFIEEGFIFHHADLSDEVRVAIEELIRLNAVKLIISTSTLAEGVNMPINTLIIRDIDFYSPRENRELISSKTFWNICGRVGRAGIENDGNVLIYIDRNKENSETKEKNYNYLINSFESNEVKSSLYSSINEIISEWDNIESFYGGNINLLLSILENISTIEIPHFETINEYIMKLDPLLLAILEENNIKSFDLEKIESIFKNSLLMIMLNKDNNSILKDNAQKILNSRAKLILGNYDKEKRKGFYKLGFKFSSCESIIEKKDKLFDLFNETFDWDSIPEERKMEILINIFEEMIVFDEMKRFVITDENIAVYRKILKDWFYRVDKTTIVRKYSKTKKDNDKILNFLNQCCYRYIPWFLNSILNYLKKTNYKIPEESEHLSFMFKYGITNLRIIMLIPSTNDQIDIAEKVEKLIPKKISSKRIVSYFENIGGTDKDVIIDENYEKILKIKKYLNNEKDNSDKYSVNFITNALLLIHEPILLNFSQNEISIFRTNGEKVIYQNLSGEFDSNFYEKIKSNILNAHVESVHSLGNEYNINVKIEFV